MPSAAVAVRAGVTLGIATRRAGVESGSMSTSVASLRNSVGGVLGRALMVSRTARAAADLRSVSSEALNWAIASSAAAHLTHSR